MPNDPPASIGIASDTTMTPPVPQAHFRCLRCGYSLEGLANPARVCPECGLDNSHESLHALSRKTQRQQWLGQWCLIIGAFGTPVPFLLGVLWQRELTRSTTVVLVTATCILSLACAVGGALVASARERVVRNRLGLAHAAWGVLLGLLVSAIALGLGYLGVLIGIFTP